MLRLWLPGQPPRKSNSRRIVKNRRAGNLMVIKSDAARDWVQLAGYHLPVDVRIGLGSSSSPLRITMDIWYKTRRPDLSGELILDTLEKYGVISNDRHVYELILRKHFSKEGPGTMVQIEVLSSADLEELDAIDQNENVAM